MSNLNEIITFEYQNEHVLEHDLPVKKNFSNPKIYNANGDLSKRWDVYFSFRNPKTGKLDRMKNIYGQTNKYKTKEDRLSILTVYRKKLLQLLKAGFNPFEENTFLYANHINTGKDIPIREETQSKSVEDTKLTLREGFDLGLKLKEKLVGERTIKSYENRIINFLKWMKENSPGIQTIDQLNKKDVARFLNDELFRTSARTRNNIRVDLGSVLQALEDNDVIPLNFIKKIPVLKSIPERNKTYTIEKQEEIFSYLEEQDPLLLLYIKFISYNLLRPIEVNRLKVEDINLKNKTIRFKAKNSPFKTKIIPQLLINDLPDLNKLKKSSLLFTPKKIGGEWGVVLQQK